MNPEEIAFQEKMKQLEEDAKFAQDIEDGLRNQLHDIQKRENDIKEALKEAKQNRIKAERAIIEASP